MRSHINAGVYVLEPLAINVIKKMKNLICQIFLKDLKKNLKTVVYPIHEPWADIGMPEDYLKVK